MAVNSGLHDSASLQRPEASLWVSGPLPNGPVVCLRDSSPLQLPGGAGMTSRSAAQ